MTSLSNAVDAPLGRPTMRDVAALAGVSLKTVSRVVNHESGVSSDLVAKVERAATQLDYRPNLTASSLRRSAGRTSTVGLLLGDVANPFSAALHRGVEEVCRLRGIAVIAASVDEDPAREQELVRTMVARRVDALIVAPSGGQQGYLEQEMRAGLPIVFVDREPRGIDGDVVVADNRAGARAAAQHLIDHGHQRIAFLGDLASLSTAQERYSGYVDALNSAGIALDHRLVVRDVHSVENARAATLTLLDVAEPPTAFFSAQNLITMGAVTALRQQGRSHDVALVGFDDFPMAEILDPGVTIVEQDPMRIGVIAAELAFARGTEPDRPNERVVVPTTLITRGSGEIPPGH
jgi:LacI family transcriptional regulator